MANIALPMSTENDGIRVFHKRIVLGTLWFALLVAGAFLLAGEKAIAKGFVLGALFSIVNFLLMGLLLPMTLGHSRRKASALALLSILSRYGILAIPLIIAVKSTSFEFVAVVVGIFAAQLVAVLDHTLIKPYLTKR